MQQVGYAFLKTQLALSAFSVPKPAVVAPVNRIVASIGGGTLQVPVHVAPKTEDPLEHILFALKHEGTNLQVLAEALPQVAVRQLVARFRESPNSIYLRKAGYLFEALTGQEIEDLPPLTAPYSDLFDADRYVTGPKQRNGKWRINFNGLGSLAYCPSVERTTKIEAAIQSDVLGRTKAFVDSIGPVNADRALGWAYLSETESSFAIEREAPSRNKAEAFVALLHQAHEPVLLTEDYLCNLQSAAITNPLDRAAAFRHQQNWLRRGGTRGATSVTYVPPAPALLHELMPAFLELANTAPKQIDPIVAAAISSFGFVYLHPFMDGNGRLSRFLFHHALCQSGRLDKGLLLPVSMAMKREESSYLETLDTFSKPARKLWDVRWIDEDQFDFVFCGRDTIYRYWDATACVDFGFRMAEQALDVHLRQETEYLARFDRIREAVNTEYDVRNNDLHVLIASALQANGVVSNNRRKQHALSVQPEVFDRIEELARRELDNAEEKPER